MQIKYRELGSTTSLNLCHSLGPPETLLIGLRPHERRTSLLPEENQGPPETLLIGLRPHERRTSLLPEENHFLPMHVKKLYIV